MAYLYSLLRTLRIAQGRNVSTRLGARHVSAGTVSRESNGVRSTWPDFAKRESDQVFGLLKAGSPWARKSFATAGGRMRESSMEKKNPSKLVDIREVVRRLNREVPTPDADGWVTMRCVNPKHADDNPSLSVNLNSGGWKCFGGCGSGNIVELVMLAKELSKDEARRWLSGTSETALVKVEKTASGEKPRPASKTSLAIVENEREYTLAEIEEKLAQAQKFTRDYAKADEWFRRVMGIGLPTVERFGLAYYKGVWGDVFKGLRVLFPVRAAAGNLLTVLGYNREQEPKVLPLRKGLGSHLYPLDQLPNDAETIIIVEGIRDCVIAYEQGLPAITGTAGAGCWKHEWSSLLRDRGVKRVIILYDHDTAGDRGAAKVASQVTLVGIEVLIAKWPEGSPPKFDLADWVASGRTLEELRTEVLDKAKPYSADIVRRSSHVVKYGELSVVRPDPHIPRSAMADIIADTLSETGVFYARGEDLWFVAGEHAFPILDKFRLAGAVDGLVEFADLEFDDDILEPDGRPTIKATYYDPPFDLFKRVLYSPYQRVKFPPLMLHTRNPQFDKSFKLIPPGYHQETGIYYAGPTITPAEGMTHIETMCREFEWKDKATDTTHFVSALLTTMLAVHFVGDHPAYVLYGNQCGLGKTLLAKLCARIVTGRTAPSITYTSNDEEFEKRIATEVDKGGSVILIDNVKTPVIESDVLERCLTDPELNFRRLCTNQSITAPNTVVFFFTMNNGSLCRDLATRSIQVNLYYEGDATKKVYENKDLVGYVLEHRWEIVAELAGMVTRFADAGCPLWSGTGTRFPRWCEIIGGILEHNGFKGFLGNMDDLEAATSDDKDDIIRLALTVAYEKKANVELPASELVRIANSVGAFREALSRSKYNAAIGLGKQLGRFTNETIEVDDFKFTLWSRKDTSNKKLYRFEFDGKLPQPPEPDKWKPKSPSNGNGEFDEPGLDAHRIPI